MLSTQHPIPAATMDLMDIDDPAVISALNEALGGLRSDVSHEWGASPRSSFRRSLLESITSSHSNPPLTYRGILKLVEGSPEPGQVISSDAASRLIYIAVDTNILLTHIHFISNLCVYLNAEPKFTIMVPWIVLEELERLRDHKGSAEWNSRDVANGTVPDRARSALAFVHDMIKAVGGGKSTGPKDPETYQLMRIQRMAEAQGSSFQSNVERVIDACSWFSANKPGHVVCLSNDVKVSEKALASGVHSFKQPGRLGVLEFVDQIKARIEAAVALSRNGISEFEPPKPRRDRAFVGRTGSIHMGNPHTWSMISDITVVDDSENSISFDDEDDVMPLSVATLQNQSPDRSPLGVRGMSMVSNSIPAAVHAHRSFAYPDELSVQYHVQRRAQHEQNMRIRAWTLGLLYRVSLDTLYTFILAQVEKELGPDWIYVVKVPPPWQLSDLLILSDLMKHTVTFRFFKGAIIPKLQAAIPYAQALEYTMKFWMKKLSKPRPRDTQDLLYAPRYGLDLDRMLSSIPKRAPLRLDEKFHLSPRQREHNYMILSMLTGTPERSWQNASITIGSRDLTPKRDQLEFAALLEELVTSTPIPNNLKFSHYRRLIGPLMGDYDAGAKFICHFFRKARQILGDPNVGSEGRDRCTQAQLRRGWTTL